MDKIASMIACIDRELRRAYDDGQDGRFTRTLTLNSEVLNKLGLEMQRLDMGRKVLRGAIKLGKLSEADVQELSELTFRKDESDRFMSRLKES